MVTMFQSCGDICLFILGSVHYLLLVCACVGGGQGNLKGERKFRDLLSWRGRGGGGLLF